MELENYKKTYTTMMQNAGCSNLAIKTFLQYLNIASTRALGTIPEDSILPCQETDILTYESLPQPPEGESFLARCAVFKLNGGLGTSMGMQTPKSLTPVVNGQSFLDITLKQLFSSSHALNRTATLFFMNSFKTDALTQSALKQSPYFEKINISSFIQNQFPKVCAHDFSPPISNDPQLLWNPPGHGDIYTCLHSEGILDALIKNSYEYLFVSNIDNVGATPDAKIAAYLKKSKTAFLMEVAKRTPMDKKGGHVAKLPFGNLTLRESSQCDKKDALAFEDISRHRYFNANNIWINIKALKDLLVLHNGVLPLPIIFNAKPLNPRDKLSTPILQFETAMGSAISLFTNSTALRIPRSRFLPVKTCADLLLIRSDCYCVDNNAILLPQTDTLPIIILDPLFYAKLDDFDARFIKGVPSLIRCTKLTLQGDIHFGKNCTCRGTVSLCNTSLQPAHIPDGSTFTDCTIQL